MKIFKPLFLLLLTIVVAIFVSSTISRIRANHVAAPYSIWFNETRPYGHISESALAAMSSEKLKDIKTVVPTRRRFEGQRENGDSVEISIADDGIQYKTITFCPKGNLDLDQRQKQQYFDFW